MTARSSRPEVRNPVLRLPAFAPLLVALSACGPQVRTAFLACLRDLSAQARAEAQRSWRANKGPMALYWKCLSVYARHFAAALRRGGGAT